MEISEAKEAIERAIERNGPYSNNIVGSVLRQVDEKHGQKEAVKLMDEYDLEEIYGIQEPKDIKND